MFRVAGLVMLCAGFLPECQAGRNLRRPSVVPQVLLSTDASDAAKTQASNSAMLKAQSGIARFFYPHFLVNLVSRKTAQPPPQENAVEDTTETGGGSSTTRMLLQLLFGLIYYFIIVSKYPELGAKEASQSAKELLEKNEDAEALDLTSSVQTGFLGVYDEEAKKEVEEVPAEEAKA